MAEEGGEVTGFTVWDYVLFAVSEGVRTEVFIPDEFLGEIAVSKTNTWIRFSHAGHGERNVCVKCPPETSMQLDEWTVQWLNRQLRLEEKYEARLDAGFLVEMRRPVSPPLDAIENSDIQEFTPHISDKNTTYPDKNEFFDIDTGNFHTISRIIAKLITAQSHLHDCLLSFSESDTESANRSSKSARVDLEFAVRYFSQTFEIQTSTSEQTRDKNV